MTLVTVWWRQDSEDVQAGDDAGEDHHEHGEGDDKSSHAVTVGELLGDLSY